MSVEEIWAAAALKQMVEARWEDGTRIRGRLLVENPRNRWVTMRVGESFRSVSSGGVIHDWLRGAEMEVLF